MKGQRRGAGTPGLAGQRGGMDKRVVETETDGTAMPATLPDILLSFLKLGTTSFGGGTVAWTNREVVGRRRWMSEDRFLQILTVAMVMPGANPVNLAVSIGQHLRGYPGAAAAAAGMIGPPFGIILLFGIGYRWISAYPQTNVVLAGLACVGIASMLQTGVKTAARLRGQVVPIIIAGLIFLAVGVLRLPMVPVVLVAVPFSIAASYLLDRRRNHG